MGYDLTSILGQAIMVLIPMILSLTVHEFAHAATAKWLGDDTAEREGRLNLNPASHIDPIGTLLLPLMILLANGGPGRGAIPFYGWAKPVPVQPIRFRRTISMRTGMTLTAAAGPVSNLAIALLVAVVLSLSVHLGFLGSIPEPLVEFLRYMLGINMGLFVFNLIPIYPLDGQKVLAGMLTGEKAIRFERFSAQYGSILLMAMVFFGQNIISYPIRVATSGVLAIVGLG